MRSHFDRIGFDLRSAVLDAIVDRVRLIVQVLGVRVAMVVVVVLMVVATVVLFGDRCML